MSGSAKLGALPAEIHVDGFAALRVRPIVAGPRAGRDGTVAVGCRGFGRAACCEKKDESETEAETSHGSSSYYAVIARVMVFPKITDQQSPLTGTHYESENFDSDLLLAKFSDSYR